MVCCGCALIVNGGTLKKVRSKNEFKKCHIDLLFLEMGDVEFYNNYSSILDILFLYDRKHIKRQIKKYSLI